MKRRITTTTSGYPNCTAEITVKRNVIKKYTDNVYLKDKQEFEILLRNNTSTTVIASISLNGKRISTSAIVLKPGQKVYLERYLDENKKFLFETYEVDNTTEVLNAIQNNGNIEVKFYKEKEIPDKRLDYFYRPLYRSANLLNNNYFNQSKLSSNTSNISYSTTSGSVTLDSFDSFAPEQMTVNSVKSVETGMVGKGGLSKQEFTDYSGEFETWPFKTVNIKIVPFSAKPLEVSDLAESCTNCGTKNKKGNYKFCPKCGNKY